MQSDSNTLVLLHHRKASIWDINIPNTHPFFASHFYLMQNWTAKTFFAEHKAKFYWKETDSETLLGYIETQTQELEQVPKVLEELEENTFDNFGNIIMMDRWWFILFYSDWHRESYIDIEKNEEQKIDRVKRITSYEPNTNKGYENKGWLIMDREWNVLINTFEKINEKAFKPVIVYNYRKEEAHEDYYNTLYPSYTYNKYDVTTSIGYIKPLDSLTDLELEEFEEATNFFYENMTSFINKWWSHCLGEYLQYIYWVPNIAEWNKLYKWVFQIFGVKSAYKEVFWI